MTKRAAIFVDGSNFFKLSEALGIYTYQLEWDRMISDLVKDRQIVYANYYDCPKNEAEVPEQARKQKQFFSHLRGIPWMKLKFGRLEPRFDERGYRHLVEKAVDVKIAVDIVLGAVRDEYDHGYLLSADGDFSPAIEAAQEQGKRIYVATPGSSYQLALVADVFIQLQRGQLAAWRRRHGGP